MGGGLMQLVAYGAQDIYLTGNPQITFFKVVYRRHTNFSMESIAQTGNGTISSSASTVTYTISRNGDLVSNMVLDLSFPSQNGAPAAATYINYVNNTGHSYIKDIELEIGGQRIDKHYGHWLDVWNELTDHNDDEKILINKHSARDAYLRSRGATALSFELVQVPLKFWFNRNPGLALPLIALQYHEVKVKLNTRSIYGILATDGTNFSGGTAAVTPTVTLYVDYIYLDTDERRRFAQQSHEYLIEQLQYQSEALSSSVKLNLNHPVKELIWTVTDSTATTEISTEAGAPNDITANVGGIGAFASNDYFNYHSIDGTPTENTNGQTSNEAFGDALLKLNGHDRFAKRHAAYFRTVQPLQVGHRVPEKHVYVYSFALKPEEHQPSGTCNFSRIDNARLDFSAHSVNGGNATATVTNATIHVYAVNYNVLRIMSGMGGLAYSN